MNPPPAAHERPADSGVSLIEVLVALGLFGLLTTILIGFALGTSRVADDTRQLSGVNEESRLAMERLTRELRQANSVLSYQLPHSTNPTALTFWTDFNGNGAQDLSVTDPEVLTYRWSPTSQVLTLTANDEDGSAVTRPVLAANVSSFQLQLFSSLWEYDANADGTTWLELDAAGAPVGDDDGIPDPIELQRVDLVKVSMTVVDGPHEQTYSTQVNLRNRNQN